MQCLTRILLVLRHSLPSHLWEPFVICHDSHLRAHYVNYGRLSSKPGEHASACLLEVIFCPFQWYSVLFTALHENLRTFYLYFFAFQDLWLRKKYLFSNCYLVSILPLSLSLILISLLMTGDFYSFNCFDEEGLITLSPFHCLFEQGDCQRKNWGPGTVDSLHLPTDSLDILFSDKCFIKYSLNQLMFFAWLWVIGLEQ